MDGLKQPIECIVCSTDCIVCSDLAGDLRTWSAKTGETISKIDRTLLLMNNVNVDDDSKLQLQVSVLLSLLIGLFFFIYV